MLPPACAHTCRLQSARPDAGEEGSRQPSPRPVPHGQVRRAACVPRPAWPWTQPRAPRCHQLGGQATASGSTHPCCVRPPGESLWVGGAPRSAAPAQPGLPPGGPGPVTDVRIQTEADASKALGHLPHGNRGCSHQGGTYSDPGQLESSLCSLAPQQAAWPQQALPGCPGLQGKPDGRAGTGAGGHSVSVSGAQITRQRHGGQVFNKDPEVQRQLLSRSRPCGWLQRLPGRWGWGDSFSTAGGWRVSAIG